MTLKRDRLLLAKQTKEIHRKIGRNVILYQQLEKLLKLIVGNIEVSGPVSKIKEILESNRTKTNTKTMGHLVTRYLDNNDPARAEEEDEEQEITEALYSFSFRIETSEENHKRTKEALEKIVAGRNKLVHHIITEFDFKSTDSLGMLNEELEEQTKDVEREIKYLQIVARDMISAQQQHSNYLSSAEFKSHFELVWLRGSRLVNVLVEIVKQIGKKDGCVPLSVAGALLVKHVPGDKASMKERYGHSSLKGLILATGMFDILEEPTSNGGTRLLYKFKEK